MPWYRVHPKEIRGTRSQTHGERDDAVGGADALPMVLLARQEAQRDHEAVSKQYDTALFMSMKRRALASRPNETY